jgi:prolyl-tRNA synthetase
MIRLREITSFKEAHTVHRNFEEAEEQVKMAISLYKEFYDFLAIPYMVTRRPDWDKFPGAAYTVAFDTIMPDGKTMQIGTVHHLADNFAKTFEIKYETPEGDHNLAHQTCYGISERCVAAVISIHGDDQGLILPFEVSPVQFVIIPVLYKGKERAVMDVAKKVESRLKEMGYRVILDDSDDRPGSKYYKWELKGAAVRIEIGPKEAENGDITISFRDEKMKSSISADELTKQNIESWAAEMKRRMWKRAFEFMKEKVRYFDSLDEIREWVAEGVALVHFCMSESCAEVIEKDTSADILGSLEEKGEWFKGSMEGECIVCGGKGVLSAISKAY